MRTIKLLGATAATGIALTALSAPSAHAAPAAPAAPAKAATVAASDLHATATASVKCGPGKGGNKRVNFSWQKGSVSTKVYFNNHCTKGKRIPATVWARAKKGPGGYVYNWKCLNTNGGTKGNKKFSTGRFSIYKIVKDNKCK
ncbi:hypothetical protein [Actinomadura hibisca]|uniref:hypothetical protein n=1 Tax=Actinomadura hibisca TaxID=68565 RepID=UPI0008377C2A|nr:hypothetical protein [Actinomadura hibisca]